MSDKNFKVKNGLTIEGTIDTLITADNVGGILVGGNPVGASAATQTSRGTLYGITDMNNAGEDVPEPGLGLGANTAVGYLALDGINSPGFYGTYNTAIGNNSLYYNFSGQANTAIGPKSLYHNDSGPENVAIGPNSLYTNMIGGYNIAVGSGALYYNTGSANTAIGKDALYYNQSTQANTAIGYQSLYYNTTGWYNSAISSETLYYNTTGEKNTAIGYRSLYNNINGNNNVGIGYYTLYNNQGGQQNIAIGFTALNSNISGEQNIAIGGNTLYNSIANDNVAIGINSQFYNTTGYQNVSIGTFNLYSNTTGNRNTSIGYGAGWAGGATNRTTTGSNNTLIGYYSIANSPTASNQITLGNSSITSLRCQVTTITSLSDGRDKKDVETIPAGLDFINDLNPVKFVWDTRPVLDENGNEIPGAGGKHGINDIGFIAQELLATEEKFNTHDWTQIVDTTNPDKLEAGYGKLVPILVKAIQELSVQVNELRSIIDSK